MINQKNSSEPQYACSKRKRYNSISMIKLSKPASTLLVGTLLEKQPSSINILFSDILVEIPLEKQPIPRNIQRSYILNSERMWLFDLRPAFSVFHHKTASTEDQRMNERSRLISGALLRIWYYWRTEFLATNGMGVTIFMKWLYSP